MSRKRIASTIADLCAAMEKIAPTWAAMDWDNVGLIAGAPDWPARRALLTIDLTPDVADEALARRVDAVIAYHPPVFRAVKRLQPGMREQEDIAAELLSRRVAVYSPHTALDASPDGANAVLAQLAGLVDLKPFRPAAAPQHGYKLVTFVPAEALGQVADAVHGAGAGIIGDYTRCSYRIEGEGTFVAGASAHPAVGKRGRLEHVAETRFETVVPQDRLGAVAAALRDAHPYEEPAFDIYPLSPQSMPDIGQGRVGRFRAPVTLGSLARELSKKTHARAAAMIGKPGTKLRRGYVCVGSAGLLPLEADEPAARGDVVITGEIRHHDALRYDRLGIAAIALGHSTSERPVIGVLARRLSRELPSTEFLISRKDRDPLVAVT